MAAMAAERGGPEVAVGAVVLADRPRSSLEAAPSKTHVLLVRRGRPPRVGSWTLPGGRVERGETLAAAVEREVREETGIAVRAGPLVEVFELLEAEFHYVILDYRAAPIDARAEPRAADDAMDARWVDLAELGSFGVTEAVARVIARAVSRADGA